MPVKAPAKLSHVKNIALELNGTTGSTVIMRVHPREIFAVKSLICLTDDESLRAIKVLQVGKVLCERELNCNGAILTDIDAASLEKDELRFVAFFVDAKGNITIDLTDPVVGFSTDKGDLQLHATLGFVTPAEKAALKAKERAAAAKATADTQAA